MTKSLLILFFALFVAMIGYGITLPALTFFVERLALEGDVSRSRLPVHIGALTASYAVTQLAVAPLWGLWSDRIGRKPLVVVGLIGFAVTQAAFGLGTSLPALYAARLTGGGFAAALLTASASYVSDWVPGPTRSRGMAWRNTAISLGVVFGPALSGSLARGDLHVDLGTEHLAIDGFSIPFLAASALALVAVPLVATYLPESLDAIHLRDSARRQVSWFVLGTDLKGMLMLVLISSLSLSLFEAVFTLYAAGELDFGIQEIGFAFAVCGLVMAVSQGGFVGYLNGRISEYRQVVAGFFLMAVGLLLLTYTRAFLPVLGAISVMSLGYALITPNLLALVANRSEPHVGAALGLQTAVTGLGQVTGPIVGGLIFVVGADIPFEVTGALSLGIAAFMITRHHGRRRNNHP